MYIFSFLFSFQQPNGKYSIKKNWRISKKQFLLKNTYSSFFCRRLQKSSSPFTISVKKILISPGNQCHIDNANASCRPNDDIPSVMISLDDYASPAVAGRYRLKFSICLKNGVFFQSVYILNYQNYHSTFNYCF